MDGVTQTSPMKKYLLIIIIAIIIVAIVGYLTFFLLKPTSTTNQTLLGQVKTKCDEYLKWFTYSDDYPAVRRAECEDKPAGEFASYHVKCSKSFCHTIYNPAGTGYYTPPNYRDYNAQYSAGSPVWFDVTGRSSVNVKFYYKSPNFTGFSVMGKNCSSPLYTWTALYKKDLEIADSWQLVNETVIIPSSDFCAVALELTLHEVQEASYSGISLI
jgi:hypothetical protein